MADHNNMFANALAGLLGGLAGGLAGGLVAATLRKTPRDEEAEPLHLQLVPLDGKGHFYQAPVARTYCWVDDLCLWQLIPSAQVREDGRGYRFVFPDGLSALFHLSSLTAPRQVGRLFEVRGQTSVRAVLDRCLILQEGGESENVPVRLAGGTFKELERQVESATGRARRDPG